MALRLIASFASLTALAAGLAFWHHIYIRTFVHAVLADVRKRLPKRLRQHEHVAESSLVQIYFDDPKIHYEVWVQRKARAIEIGLHFEGPRDENARWAETLAARADEIRAQLGGDVELEQWTRSWVRLHESIPLDTNLSRSVSSQLSDDLRERVTNRLARFIEVLEPILAEERAAAR